jgi:putative addiction module killer protein
MIEVRQTDVFAAWFAGLRDHAARARITARIRRLSLGNPGDVKPVGQGVPEMAKRWSSCYAAAISAAKAAISPGLWNWPKRCDHGA